MFTVFDNPVCEETHNGTINKKFEDYVIAFLEKLKYLNYRQIKTERREEAKERYHDELLGLHDKEAAEGNKMEKDEAMIQQTELLMKANVAGADTLFQDMMSQDPEAKMMEIIQDRIAEHTAAYKEKFSSAVEQFKIDMISNLKLKTDELEELASTLNQSQYENNTISKNLLKDFEKRKKQILNSVREVGDSEEEDLKQLDELRRSLIHVC
jgi:hypothetical protein